MAAKGQFLRSLLRLDFVTIQIKTHFADKNKMESWPGGEDDLMEQLEQLKKMLGDAQERLKQNPDFKLVNSLESLIADLEIAFGPIETSSKKVETTAEVVETAPEVSKTIAPVIAAELTAEIVEDVTTEIEEETVVEAAEETSNEVVEVAAEEASVEAASEVVAEEVSEELSADETAIEEVVEAVSEKTAEPEDIVEALAAMPEVSVDMEPTPEIVEDVFAVEAKQDIDSVQSDALESNLEDALNEMIEASSDVTEKDPLEKSNPFSSMAIMASNRSANAAN